MRGILWAIWSVVLFPTFLEFLPELAPQLARNVLRFAAGWLPPEQRWRYLREWVADVRMQFHKGKPRYAVYLAIQIALAAPATALAVRPVRPVLAHWAYQATRLLLRVDPWILLLLLAGLLLAGQYGWPPTIAGWLEHAVGNPIVGTAIGYIFICYMYRALRSTWRGVDRGRLSVGILVILALAAYVSYRTTDVKRRLYAFFTYYDGYWLAEDAQGCNVPATYGHAFGRRRQYLAAVVTTACGLVGRFTAALPDYANILLRAALPYRLDGRLRNATTVRDHGLNVATTATGWSRSLGGYGDEVDAASRSRDSHSWPASFRLRPTMAVVPLESLQCV